MLTALNYAALTGYDLLAFAYIGKTLPRAHIALASFLAYAISNNIGFAMLSGASVRYRFYTRWGVTAQELSRIVFSYSVTFWLGLLGLGGLSFVVSPLAAARELPAHGLLLLVAWLLMLSRRRICWRPSFDGGHCVSGASSCRCRRRDRPGSGADLGHRVDAGRSGAVRVVAVERPVLSPVPRCLPMAILLGMASHVPGGVGVFEGLMVLLLKPYLTSGQLLPALVVYRAVYYLVPLGVALIVLVADVTRQHRAPAARIRAALGRLTEQLAPRVLAVFTFLAGLVLLFSGATPAASGRLELLSRVLPVGVIEASHFLSSVAGAVLLILSQGLARRLDAAYYLTAATIVVGMAVSLLKGVDYEEAGLLLLVLLVLRRARPAFDRRAAFFDTRFSRGLDCRDGRRCRRFGVAGTVCVQARGLFARALVAVRSCRVRHRDSSGPRLAPRRSCCCSDLPV